METFSQRLLWSIERSGLGRPEFAAQVGVGTSALAKWISGKLLPKSEQLLKIARAAKVSIDWLISGNGSPTRVMAYTKMLSRFKEVTLKMHPNDLNAQESLIDFLTDSVVPIIDEMSIWTSSEDSPLSDGAAKVKAKSQIPVIGWAHAGQASSYEELPKSWQTMIPTDCRDPKAFAVTLEGDSMERDFREGDQLVLMPSERIHNGCLAVLRLADDGVLFRRIEMRADRLRLVPLNPRYETEELPGDQVSWAYPLWGSWRQVWR